MRETISLTLPSTVLFLLFPSLYSSLIVCKNYVSSRIFVCYDLFVTGFISSLYLFDFSAKQFRYSPLSCRINPKMAETKLGLRFFGSLIVAIFCLSGLVYQLVHITKYYTEYNFNTQVKISLPNELLVPDLSICAHYLTMIDFGQYGDRYGVDVPKRDMVWDEILNLVGNNLTIADIFEMTPPESATLSSCVIRPPLTYKYEEHRRRECYRHFEVTKFYQQEYVCYRYSQTKVRDQHFTRNVAYALSFPSVLYRLQLDDKVFNRTYEIKVMGE